jgi:hypothetical protein
MIKAPGKMVLGRAGGHAGKGAPCSESARARGLTAILYEATTSPTSTGSALDRQAKGPRR